MSEWTAQHAHDYDEKWGELAFHREIPRLAGVQPGFHVTEIGCGGGYLSLCLAQSHPNVTVTALDPSATMIERANARKEKAELQSSSVQFLQIGAEDLDLPADSQDLIIAPFSVHHWQDAAVAMKNVVHAIKPNGRFWICEDLNTPEFGDLDVSNELKSLGGLKALLDTNGFSEINHHQVNTDEGDFLIVEGIWRPEK